MRLSFIIINHHSEQYLRPCIDSIITAQIPFAYEIIIINNDAKSASFSFPEKSNVSIIEAGENLGFGKANNLAAKTAQGECLCFLNSDTELLPEQNISEITSLFEKDSPIGIIAPRLVTDKKTLSVQPWSAGREINLWDTLLNNFGAVRSKKVWTSKKTVAAAWVSGAAMFVKKEFFEQMGGFDEKFFMYFEDADLCKRMRESGKKVLYCPKYSVFHWLGKSCPDKKIQKSHYYASQDYYFEKHFGKLPSLIVRVLRKIFGKI